ncbi:oxidoreductase [Streptomyces sp. NPDC087300]|uniref:oxidoreductase n=1 Tax=Streptomyces sp. NPDC087300 TaxID=3365780 RepID=UPI0037FAB75A
MPGNWETGPDLAAALRSDVERAVATHRLKLDRGKVTAVSGHAAGVGIELADATTRTADAAVIATGVTARTPADSAWIAAPDGFLPPPLWRTAPAGMHGVTYVLGADRPLGTWLRAHPRVGLNLNVLCPAEDGYKTAEIADDPRVNVMRISHVEIAEEADGRPELTVTHRDGEQRRYLAATVLSNLGNSPAALDGLKRGLDGYCPPELQHPRLLVAGDLRSARFQRIVTAQGSGAQAALARYYDVALARA